MKNKGLLIASFLALTILASCSKTLILSDGNSTKKIRVATKIVVKKDENNHKILSFESANGTKYTIDTEQYEYTIK